MIKSSIVKDELYRVTRGKGTFSIFRYILEENNIIVDILSDTKSKNHGDVQYLIKKTCLQGGDTETEVDYIGRCLILKGLES